MKMFAEGLRRMLWALIRVENEFFNNYENYRSVLTIPSLFGQLDKPNNESQF